MVFVACKGRKGGGRGASVMGALLDMVFNIAEPLGSWQSVKLIGIAYW